MAISLESKWVSYRAAAYLQGRGIIYGCGPNTPFPLEAKAPGVYAVVIDPAPHPLVSFIEAADFSGLADRAYNFVFCGVNTPPNITAKLIKKLRVNGHLIIHSVGPRSTEHMAMVEVAGHWQAKIDMVRDEQRLTVLKLVDAEGAGVASVVPVEPPRACICRYGAIGDMIMVTPLIRALHERGFKVTVNTTSYSAEVLLHNPYVSNVIVQERNIVPNAELGGYWREWMGDYERYINLSESIEGGLLKLENRVDFYTPASDRHAVCNINYTDQTLALGNCSDAKNKLPELFFSPAEHKAAKSYLRSVGARAGVVTIMWGLNGSSYHKRYPLLKSVLEKWLPQHPEVRVLLSGNEQAKPLEFDMPQVIRASGALSLRMMLALATTVDIVVGPESALVNAAAASANHKIVLLSHSTHENLTKYWLNTTVLPPDRGQAPCYPCHQLHYSLESCPLVEHDGVPIPACTLGVSTERMTAALDEALVRVNQDALVPA